MKSPWIANLKKGKKMEETRRGDRSVKVVEVKGHGHHKPLLVSQLIKNATLESPISNPTSEAWDLHSI